MENNNKDVDKLRVGIYLRLSDEDKNKLNKVDESESIKNQRLLLINEINKNCNFVLADEYCDENLSGAGTHRPEFERLINDCQNGKLNIVMAKSQSRFSRDMEIIEKYLHNKFYEWNVRFISLSDNADTFNYGNKKSRQINGLVNEWFLEDVSNNIRSAFNAKMKNGEFISPFAPYGYEISKYNNNKLVVDKYASLIVKKIYKLYEKGLGYEAIAKYLNNKNILSPSSYKKSKGSKINIVSKRDVRDIKWSGNAIKSILINEVYTGKLIQGKRSTISYKNKKVIKKNKDKWITAFDTHDAIISDDLFNKVMLIMNSKVKANHKTGLLHCFSSKIFCLECNGYMQKNSTIKHSYLGCSSKKNQYIMCNNKLSIRYDMLESLIINEINKLCENYYDKNFIENIYLEDSLKDNTDSIKYNLNIRLNELQKELNSVRLYFKSLYEDKVNKIITNEQFETLNNYYNNQESLIIRQISNIKEEINVYKSKTKLNISPTYKKIAKLNRFIVNEFIDKIYIGAVNKKLNTRIIKIIWNTNI